MTKEEMETGYRRAAHSFMGATLDMRICTNDLAKRAKEGFSNDVFRHKSDEIYKVAQDLLHARKGMVHYAKLIDNYEVEPLEPPLEHGR